MKRQSAPRTNTRRMQTTLIDQCLAAPPPNDFPQIQGDRRWEFQSVVGLNLREIRGAHRRSRRWFGVPALAGAAWNGARRASWNVACCRGVRRLKAGLQTGVAIAAACLLVVTLTGCLSRPPLARETFALTLPAAPESTSASGTAVLLLRSVVVAPMFDGKALVYRRGEHTWEQDPYAEFLVPPAAMLAGPLRTALRRSGVFRDVIEPGSALTPDRVAEIQVTEFYGDFRNQAEPMAVLALRCTIFEIGPKQRVRLQKEYARRLALPERTAAGVVAGWNEALGQILGELAGDLQVR